MTDPMIWYLPLCEAQVTRKSVVLPEGTSQDEVARRIAVRRAGLVAARNAPGDPVTVAQRALARRKNETPSSVIALEVLSQIIPDNTYVTELRIEENKLRLSGVSQDAPALIRLIEQSRHFSNPVQSES